MREGNQSVGIKNLKPAEFATGFRTKIAKDVAIIDFVHTEVFNENEEYYLISSIAITKDTATDLIKKLQTFVAYND